MKRRLVCEGASVRDALVEHEAFSPVAATLHEKQMMPASQNILHIMYFPFVEVIKPHNSLSIRRTQTLTVLFHYVLQMRVMLYENDKSRHRFCMPQHHLLITLLLINGALLFGLWLTMCIDSYKVMKLVNELESGATL